MAPTVFELHLLIGMPFLPPLRRGRVKPRDDERLWIDGELRAELCIHAGIVEWRLIVWPRHHHIEGA